MKTKYLFLSLVFAAFLSSSIPAGSHSLMPGEEAPSLVLSANSKVKSLKELDGKYVVVNFWSSSDPESRIANSRLAKLADSLPSSKVKFVSICTDTDETLASEIIKADNLPSSAISLSHSDIDAEVAEDYQVATGNRSFLIDPFGNLVKISPSEEEVIKIVA
ncbi:MAG: peroxiredoxin family protein [Muribaculaceae bacterium]|nr:peroxiredoxin family protein [Muribaculaceae bacterium]MDE6792981.1 peroxiredoxin family protein [Muribaculaceae bacterium]